MLFSFFPFSFSFFFSLDFWESQIVSIIKSAVRYGWSIPEAGREKCWYRIEIFTWYSDWFFQLGLFEFLILLIIKGKTSFGRFARCAEREGGRYTAQISSWYLDWFYFFLYVGFLRFWTCYLRKRKCNIYRTIVLFCVVIYYVLRMRNIISSIYTPHLVCRECRTKKGCIRLRFEIGV